MEATQLSHKFLHNLLFFAQYEHSITRLSISIVAFALATIFACIKVMKIHNENDCTIQRQDVCMCRFKLYIHLKTLKCGPGNFVRQQLWYSSQNIKKKENEHLMLEHSAKLQPFCLLPLYLALMLDFWLSRVASRVCNSKAETVNFNYNGNGNGASNTIDEKKLAQPKGLLYSYFCVSFLLLIFRSIHFFFCLCYQCDYFWRRD